MLPVLGKLRGMPPATTTRGTIAVIDGELPAASVHRLRVRLPGLTRGEGLVESVFERWEAM